MNYKKYFITILTIACSALFVEAVYAYEAVRDNEDCIKPKFRKFIPPNHSEVAPGSEISFHVTHSALPKKIQVTVKKIPVEISVEDRNIFYIVRAKLPLSLQNTYARISLRAEALLGCSSSDGWLLKISEAAVPAATSVDISEETATTEVKPEESSAAE